MGCDGGSIPTRRELVKEKQKHIIPDSNIQILQQWYHCALSKDPLQTPVVSDSLGKLYNKEAILSFLVNKQAYGDGDVICSHITSLKDITTLNLHPNPAYSSSTSSNSNNNNNNKNTASNRENSSIQSTSTNTSTIVSPFVCPITLKEMNGKHRFSYIDTCGCVLSETGLKQVPGPNCPNCNIPYNTNENIIPINSTKEDEITKLKDRMECIRTERIRISAERKAEKAAAAAAATNGGGDNVLVKKKRRKESTNADEDTLRQKKPNLNTNISVNLPSTLNAEIARSAAKLSVESEAIQSLYTKKNVDVQGRSTETFLTRGTFTRYSSFAS